QPTVAFIPAKPIEGIALAAADKSAVRDAAPKPAVQRDAGPRRPRPQVVPTTRPKEEHPSPVYRAIFKDNVVITQLDQRLATADQPLEITWTGRLTLTPVLGDRPDRIAPGEAVVKLIAREGRFVEVNREANAVKSTIHAGTLTHWTLDDGALIEEGPGAPVEMF